MWYKYVIHFLIWWFVIVAMELAAVYLDVKYAAIVYALPIQFTLAAIFIYFDLWKSALVSLTKDSLIYIAAFVLFIILFYIFLKYLNFWQSMFLSYFIFILFVWFLLCMF